MLQAYSYRMFKNQIHNNTTARKTLQQLKFRNLFENSEVAI